MTVSKAATTRRKLVVVLVALAILALTASVIAVLNFQRADETPQASAIPSLAPADSDTFVVAPYSQKWWATVAAFDDPNKQLLGLDPAASGLNITHIGYSRSTDHAKRDLQFTGALRLFYLESPTAVEAGKVADWLKTSALSEGRRVYIRGTIVVVGGSWLDSYTPPAKTMSSVGQYTARPAGTEATMWMNPSEEASSLTGRPSARFNAFLSDTTGFTTATTWIGTSTDGATWSGDFTSGGADPKRVNLEKANKALRTAEKTLATVVGPTSTAKIIDPGMSEILDVASFEAGTQTLGKSVDRLDAPAVKDPVVSVVNDVTGWDAAISGISGPRENQGTRILSANEKAMTISYTGS
ncbi:hypothetical protein [Arthrobacter sp. A2-55]|uniref:hypothetical protein n=1 Tax=Arthrobacter sp. A2-55 TaxID=2897337 RepID=UPI0021CDACD0|nr:hypothetical protein [Arthrobacter sp. A2-55]MCU6480144.1 hypothetical protein [Arthrobacter sp. A2-55]